MDRAAAVILVIWRELMALVQGQIQSRSRLQQGCRLRMLHPRNWNFLFIRKMRHGFAYACAPITFSGSAEHRRKPRMIRPGPFGKSEDGTDGSSMQDSNADEDYVQTLQRHIAEARLRLGGSAARSA